MGAGHATSLFLLGLPIVFWRVFLPGRVQQLAEVAIGLLVIALASWLLARWRSGALANGGSVRSPLTAYGIGCVHGVGGSAGICLLLLAAIPGRAVALAALAIFSFGTCVSMALLSAGFGCVLGGRGALRAAPVLSVASLAFGVWYVLVAVNAL